MNFVAKLVVFCALLLAALALAPFARHSWFMTFVNERTFSTSLSWFNPPQAIFWLFELLFFFIFGVLVAWLFRSTAPLSCALFFGAICGAFHFWLSKDHFAPEAPATMYVWVYGNYVMPLVGALLGAFALQLAPNYSFKRTTGIGLR